MKGHPLHWTPEMIVYLRGVWKLADIHRATELFNSRFRTQFTETQIKSCTSRHHMKSGRTGRFEKGQVPVNAGTKGMMKRNRGTFRKGNTPGNIRPLGSVRIDSKDGFVLVKIRRRNPYTGAPTMFKAKHVVLWEKWNGLVPNGSAVVFADGNRRNFKKKNLVLVTRRELARMNRWLEFGKAPAAVKPIIIALAKVQMKTFALEKKLV